jgi:hypothetical protein
LNIADVRPGIIFRPALHAELRQYSEKDCRILYGGSAQYVSSDLWQKLEAYLKLGFSLILPVENPTYFLLLLRPRIGDLKRTLLFSVIPISIVWQMAAAIYRQQKVLSHFPVCCWID